ncbi:MAG: hypothetical protein DRP33_04475 [Thermotogae bacterium]|nr:MAG: hypothetical protein DRP33_04475 [Thermotogota bacterium]
MTMRTVDPGELEALIEGAAILGTGGGGDREFGIAILEDDVRKSREWIMIDPVDVPDEALVVSGGIMGSVKALLEKSVRAIVEKWENDFELLNVTRLMERYLKQDVAYFVPFEIGCLNTPVVMTLCARMGIPMIDGDGLGRAAPETQMTSFIGHDIRLCPMPLIDTERNAIIVDSDDIFLPDEVGRWFITKSGQMGANNHYPMTGKQLKKAVIPNTVTKAIELGKLVATQDNAVEKVADFLGGKVLLSGEVVGVEEEDRGGFFYKFASITDGHNTVRITIKNEYMLCRFNEQIVTVFPDLIVVVDENGRGVMSTDLMKGKNVTVIVAPAHERLREAVKSSLGKIAMSSDRFGENVSYEPVEILLSRVGIE